MAHTAREWRQGRRPALRARSARLLACVALALLAACGGADDEPVAMHVIMFWPSPGQAALWCSAQDRWDKPVAVEGTATVVLWELETRGGGLAAVGPPLSESTLRISPESFSPSAEDCVPCALEGRAGAAPLGTIDLDWLPIEPTRSMGRIEVALALASGRVLTDTVDFGFPE